jgi:SWI/SNF-related matrix-associated actin-dependent regulator of chromatin subfamily D
METGQSSWGAGQGRRVYSQARRRFRKGEPAQLLANQILPANVDSIPFHQLPEHVTRFLSHPEPVIIPYTIRVDRDFHFHQKCFDIPIELEDPVKSKMSSLLTSFDGEEGKEIVKLEDKVAEMVYFTRDLKQKRDFLESFS